MSFKNIGEINMFFMIYKTLHYPKILKMFLWVEVNVIPNGSIDLLTGIKSPAKGKYVNKYK